MSTADVDRLLPRDFRLRPIEAWRGVQRLLRDKEDTKAVFDIMRALSGRAIPNGYRRLLASFKGGRIAYRRPEMAALFGDDAWLDGFADGSVGAAYRKFVRAEQISADGLAEESRAGPEGGFIDLEHPFTWYARRLRDVHDVWHVLTGYGRDALGEACLVAFSFPQTRSLGFGLIALAGGDALQKAAPDQPIWAAIQEAWARGRACAWLPEQDYESLFAEPLDQARGRLGLSAPTAYQAIPEAVRNGLKP
jgi:ubiquinone biosynthesis protein COQ4